MPASISRGLRSNSSAWRRFARAYPRPQGERFCRPGFGGGICIEPNYVDGSWRGDALTLKAPPWCGIVATRSELGLLGPEIVAVPADLQAWLAGQVFGLVSEALMIGPFRGVPGGGRPAGAASDGLGAAADGVRGAVADARAKEPTTAWTSR